MANVTQQIKNFIAGVSQQPNILKFVDQLDEQINGLSTTAKGLQKRPPTSHVANLGEVYYPSKPLVHFINRDEREQYTVNFTGNSVKVWGLDGKEYPVTLQGNAMDYIQTPNPRSDLKVITVADYTFIVNTKKTTDILPVINDHAWDNQGALISIKSGQYGRAYVVYLNGEEACRYNTPDGSDPSHAWQISTTVMVEGMIKDVQAKGKWSIVHGEGWIYLYHPTIPIKELRTLDGGNNSYMFGFLKATQRFSNLPMTAPPYFAVLVKGDNMSLSDDYYVRFNPESNLWEECARPNQKNFFNSDTMPHALVRQADGVSFVLKNLDWDARKAGDDESNPYPSFLGKPINDVCFIRNRLGFLAGENVILSASGEFFRFFLKTAREISDADPIDVSAPDEDISILKHAIPFNEELLLFSDSSQFIGRSDSLFSPKYFKVDRTTKFDCTPNCRPVSAGRRVYFTNARSSYSSLMEYYIIGDTSNIKDAQDVSSHIPEYIPNDVHKVIVSTTENMLLLLSTGALDTIYVYKYAWQNENRVQSSWSKWVFEGAEVLGGSFIGAYLYLMLKRGSATYLEKIKLSSDTLDIPTEPYRLYMDRKTSYVIPTGTYDSVRNVTDFRPMTPYSNLGVPSTHSETSMYCITHEGSLTKFDLTESNPLLSLVGNREGQTVFIGQVTLFMAQLQEVMIKNIDKSGNLVATNSGRLQVKYFVLNYENSGLFSVTVEVEGKDTYEYLMTSRTLGDSSNALGSMPITSGEFQFPIQSDSRDTKITVISHAPLPLSLIGGRWEGNHVERSGR